MNRGFDFDELVDRREVAALKYNVASMKRICRSRLETCDDRRLGPKSGSDTHARESAR